MPPRTSRCLLLFAASVAGLALSRAAVQPVANAESVGRVAACPSRISPGNPDVQPPNVKIIFTNECGENVPLSVDVASTESEQESGLMNVRDLPADEGELFAFQNLAGGGQVIVSFWMEDTPIPLSIAFIGADNEVQEIQDMQAETTNLHTPRAPYLYAVEANLNWFAEHNIIPGDSVDLSAAMQPQTLAPSTTAPGP